MLGVKESVEFSARIPVDNHQSSFSGVPFPKNFLSIAKTILKRLFRVYAHIYHQHFGEVVQLSEEAHLNTSFKHFIFFVQEFNLIERRELAPLQELIDQLTSKDRWGDWNIYGHVSGSRHVKYGMNERP